MFVIWNAFLHFVLAAHLNGCVEERSSRSEVAAATAPYLDFGQISSALEEVTLTFGRRDIFLMENFQSHIEMIALMRDELGTSPHTHAQ